MDNIHGIDKAGEDGSEAMITIQPCLVGGEKDREQEGRGEFAYLVVGRQASSL